MWKILAKKALYLHNFAYKLSSFLAIKAEGGEHPKHRLMDYHKFFLDNIQPKDKVLDIGCGQGELAFDLAKKASKVVGIDFNEKYLAKAKEKYKSENIEYILGNAAEYDFKENFDIAILSNVLEHIEKRQEFLQKIKPLARKFLIRVPILDRDWLTLYKKEIGVEHRLDRGHFIEYTLEGFKSELSGAGFYIEQYFIQFGEIYAIIL